MSKSVKIWSARPLKGGETIVKKTLKSLCLAIGLSYSTAKNKQKEKEAKTVYVIGEKVFEVWMEKVED